MRWYGVSMVSGCFLCSFVCCEEAIHYLFINVAFPSWFEVGLHVSWVDQILWFLWVSFVPCCKACAKILKLIMFVCLIGFCIIRKIHNEKSFDNRAPSIFLDLTLVHVDLHFIFPSCRRTTSSILDQLILGYFGVSPSPLRGFRII